MHPKLLYILLLFLPFSSFAGKIKKGFEALDIYNYFEAKRIFEKKLKSHPVACGYGLSIIYYRADNPFHNIDSAYKFVTLSVNSFSSLDARNKEQYLEFGIDSAAIINQRELVSDSLYVRVVKQNQIENFNHFISTNYWSKHIPQAVFKRDSLAFESALKNGNSDAFSSFMLDFPFSEFSESAKAKYEETLYSENTASNTLLSYMDFIRLHPDSPYRFDAENKIYEIYTEIGTVESYRRFIIDCPDNHNVNEAWIKMYNAYLQNNTYSENSIETFINNNPEFPELENLLKEKELSSLKFYPIKENDKWGFIDEQGIQRTPLIFDEAYSFYEGLAIVRLEGKYGYINKMGDLVIKPKFDDAFRFQEGHAVVEINEKLGIINRSGEFIIPPKYEELGNISEGLCYYLDDSLYGYFDSKGIVRIEPKFTDANDFMDNKAVVSQNGFYGLIDKFGTTYLPMKYEQLREYDSLRYLAMLNGYWGLISLKGDTILNFEYDYIGNLNENRAIVEKDGMFNYVNNSGKLVLTEWLSVFAEYRQLAVFKNGYARVEFAGKYNLIDSTGKKLFAQPKENVGSYATLVAVQKDGKWGYYNTAGNLVISHTFSSAFSFNGNYAIVQQDPFFGLIDKTGKLVVQTYFESLKFLNDTLLIAKSLGEYGILNIQGDTIMSFNYILIEPISDSVVKVEEGGQLYFYDIYRQKALRKEGE